jgi:hypothetical protein
VIELRAGYYPPERVDLDISFGGKSPWQRDILASRHTPRYTSPYLNEDGQPSLRVWLVADGAFYRFHYGEGIDFVLSRDSGRLWICWPEAVSERDVLSYLLGPMMGCVLRLRGTVCLHASAVVLNERAVVFVGGLCAGKSTTAMAFGRLGHPIIADDVVPIFHSAGVTYAQPGYPRVRLRPPALPVLSDINLDLPPLPAPEGQRRLHFDLRSQGYKFQSYPLPVDVIYLLCERNAGTDGPRVESIRPTDAIMGLIANTYATRFLDKSMRAQEVKELSELVNRVPVRKIYPHRELSRLPALCEVVLEDSGSVSQEH